MPAPDDFEERILVLAPTGRDAALSCAVLAKTGIRAEACASIEALCDAFAAGAGAALIAEEALAPSAARALLTVLDAQPPWSDFPLVVLTTNSATTRTSLRVRAFVAACANVTLVERPVHIITLQTALHGALRTRRRQYETRDFLAERDTLVVKLAEERERLREADRRKDEFLAMLAHELRNPLASLANGVRLARHDTYRFAALEMADRQIGHLSRLLDDLLDVSRITQGKVALRKEPIELREIFRLALEMTRAEVEARTHLLEVVLPSEPVLVVADKTRLAQALVNLLTNAIKYTNPGGQIVLRAERVGDDVVLRVSDNGIGIAPDVLPSVFDLFTQADRSLEHAEGGLGIGLTLVRTLIAMHGGRVEAHSEGLDRGAEFVIHLPVAPSESPRLVAADRADAPRHPPRTERLRVLVVDDNQDAAESLATLLGLFGHRVVVAHDGQRALATARAFAPHVVLLDIGLPGLDGYEVARRLRREPSLAPVLLIALSGYGQEEVRRRACEAGFDHYFVKPTDVVAINELLTNKSAQILAATGGEPSMSGGCDTEGRAGRAD
jgi:signal transduction histidine kinase/CheY-like chemotaxis protein